MCPSNYSRFNVIIDYVIILVSLSSGPVLRHLAESSITTTEINL